MASMTVTGAEGFSYLWDILGLINHPVSAGAGAIQWVIDEEGEILTVTAEGTFANPDADGVPQTGTITAFSIVTATQTVTITGLNASLAGMFAAVAANDALALHNQWFAGADTMTLTAQGDAFPGYGGNDTINGGGGNDGLYGRDGDDTLNGETGDDSLYGGFGNDTLNGGDNNDVVFGGRGIDILNGGEGNDLLGGGAGIGSITQVTPIMNWSFGNYVGEASADVLDGGNGFDFAIFYYLHDAAGYTVNISSPAVLTNVLRGGAAFGSVVNIEAMYAQGGLNQDAFTGGNFNDTLLGGAGNDTLIGNGGVDVLNGESGDDTITGGGGNDSIAGGTGTDTAVYSGGFANYTINWNSATLSWVVTDIRGGAPDGVDTLTGIEYLRFNDVTAYPLSAPPAATSGDDVLATSYSPQFNMVFGLDGNDTITAPVGTSNSLNGGNGNDTITGGAGDDQIDGGAGADNLNIGGSAGLNIVNGGAGNDVITGNGSAGSVLNGEDGNDLVTGDGTLYGGLGDDVLTDTANAIAGILDGGPGNDTLNGDSNLSVASYALAPDAVTVDLRLGGTAQNTVGAGNDTLVNIRNVTGSGYDDTLFGDGNNNTLSGGTGDDTLLGLGGNDTLVGSFGDDYMDGGLGIDTANYAGMSVGVEIDLAMPGRQTDSTPTVGFDYLVNIENITGSAFNDILDGDEGANVLIGLAGVDDLDGNGGDDTLNGGAGNDFLNGGAGLDKAVFAGARPLYTITDNFDGTTTVSSAAEGVDILTGVEILQFSNETLIIANKEPATVDAGDSVARYQGEFGLAAYHAATPFYAGAGQIVVELGGGETYSLLGVFTLMDGVPVSGTITEIARSGGDHDFSLTGVTLDLAAFNALAAAGDEAGFRALALSGESATYGSDNDDVIHADAGDDLINGGAGSDTVFLTGNRADYTIAIYEDVIFVTGPDGEDGLVGVEHLKFADGVTVHLPGHGAIVTVTGDDEDFRWTGLSALLDAPVASHDSSSVVLDTSSDEGPATVTILGYFTAFDANGFPTAGQVTGLTSEEGAYHLSITGVSMDVAVFTALLAGNESLALQADWFSGDDTFTGSDDADPDFLPGNDGNDTLNGGAGNDGLNGGDGDDVANGGAGGDSIYAGFGDDILNGDADNDVLFGGRGTDIVNGGAGMDLVAGGFGIGALTALTPTWTFGNYVGEASPDVLDGGADFDYALFYFLIEDASYTVNIFNQGAVNTVLRNGVAFGSVTNVEALWAQGGFGNDSFTGSTNNDTLLGGYGNDVLVGHEGVDSLTGESGDDTLTGGYGNDTLNGGTGLDTAVFSGAKANYSIGINAVTGAATVTDNRPGADGVDTLTSIEFLQFADGTYNLLTTVQTGTAGAETLTGTSNADVLIGLGDNDILNGVNGDDSLNGGAGNDTIDGGIGNDTIDGGAGNDTLAGGAGNDTVNGGDGNDIITDSGSTADVLNGEGGDDTVTGDGLLFGSLGDDILTDIANGFTGTLDGGLGNDTLNGDGALTIATYSLTGDAVQVDLRIVGAQNTGGGGVDTLNNIRNVTGTGYDDVLIGDDFANSFQAGNGADTLIGNGGADTLNGLYGDDLLDGGAGLDTASWSGLLAGVEVDLKIQDQPQYTGGGGLDTLISIENLTGSGVNDRLFGDSGANVLRGLTGDDELVGDQGDDTLIGDLGNDILNGGDGIDTASFQFETGPITATLATQGVQQNTGAGLDTFISIENLTGSNQIDTLTGNTGANVLSGGGGNDTLNGGDGDDTLIGGIGNDTLNGGLGKDTASYAADAGGLTIDLTLAGAQGNGDTLISIENVIGTTGVDILTGNNDDNVLTGAAGNDILNGGGGIDTAVFSGARASYTISATTTGLVVSTAGSDGVDTLTGFEFLQFADGTIAAPPLAVVGTAGNDVMNGTSANDTLSGLDGRDVIYGHDGDDSLDGGLLGDQLSGGNGGDNVRGGDGDDMVSGARVNYLAFGTYNLMSNDYAADVIDGGNGNDIMIIDLIGEHANYTINLGTPLAVTSVLRDGVAHGSFVNVEGLHGRGSQGDDVLTGGTMNDNIQGGAGDDLLSGGIGADVLGGEGGDDTLNGGAANDTLNGGAGVDTAVFSAALASYTITFNSTANTLTVTGPDGTDTLSNIEYLQFSDQTIAAPNFVQFLTGGGSLTGGADDDALIGGAGADTLNGGEGRNSIAGEGGDDTITAGAGADSIDGGDGDDVINAGAGFDTVYGGAGDDVIEGTGGDTLIGDDGDDTLTGDGGSLYGGFGEDILTDMAGGLGSFMEGGPDADRLIGDGNSTAGYSLSNLGVTVDLNVTTAQDTGGGGVDTITGVRNLFGSSLDDVLTGNSLNNTLSGTAGNDLLAGNLGDDILNGGSGVNILQGGDGSDTAAYAVSGGFQPGVNVDLRNTGAQNTGLGVDTLVSIENLTGGSNNDALTGNDDANVLTGNAGNDTLNGMGGADTLTGGAGNDTMVGGDGADTAVFSGARSAYTVSDLGGGVTQLVNATDGTDTATGVETFRFTDGDYTLAGLLAGGSVPSKPVLGVPQAGEELGPNYYVNGSTSPGSTVNVYADGVLIGSGSTFGPGIFLISNLDFSGVADGPHTLTVIATNSAGTSLTSAPTAVIVDTVAPDAPSVTSDTGATADNTPLLEGVAEAGAYIEVRKAGSSNLATGYADETGHWSLQLPELADGEHDLIVVATDHARNASTTTPVSFDIQSATPDAPVITTASGTIADDELTVSGTAGANLTIDIYVDGVLTTQTTSDGDGDWSVLVDTLDEGPVEITAIARNGVGASSAASAPLEVTVDISTQDVVVLTGEGLIDDLTPTFTGTAEAGSTVSLVSDTGILLATTTADGSGAWTLTSPGLSQGEWVLTVTATDPYGNVANPATATVTIDTVSPNQPAFTSDDGVIASDDYTLTGTAEGGATIEIRDGSVVLASFEVDASGDWSVDLTDLAEGAHMLSARVTDAVGHVSNPAYINLYVDTIAPDAPVFTSAGGVIAGDDYTLTGTAEAGAKVEVRDGGVLLATLTADRDGKFTLDLTDLVEGGHSLTATATDTAGHTSTAATLNLTIDPPGPALTVDLVLANDTGASNSDHITRDGHATISGTSDVGAKVIIYDNGVQIRQITVGATGTWSYNANFGAGDHAVTVTATKGGLTSTYGGALPTITVDTTAPAVSVTSQTLLNDTGSSAADRITSDGHVDLVGTAEAGSTVNLYDAGALIGTTTASGTGDWSFNLDLAEGVHTLQAKATDVAGNTGSSLVQSTITVDKTANAAAITAQTLAADTGASASDNVTNNGKVTLTGTGQAGQLVSIYDGATKIGQVTVGSGGTWSFTTSTASPLAEGVHTLSAEAVDKAGNVTAMAAQATITVDKTAPVSSTINPVAANTNNAAYAISGVTSEAGGAVDILRDGVVVAQVTADGAGAWTYTPSGPLADARYVYTARALDLAGNNKLSAAAVVTVDTSGPATPAITGIATDSGASATDGVTKDNTLLVKGTAEAGANVLLFQDGVQVASVTANGAGVWQYNYGATVLADGDYALTAVAVDKAGNTSAASTAFHAVIDTAAPTGTTVGVNANDIVLPANGYTNNGSVTLFGNAEAGSTVVVTSSVFGVLGTVTADTSGHWTLDHGFTYEGRQTITAKATDLAGNMSTTASATFTIDTYQPHTQIRNAVNAGAFTTLSGVSEASSQLKVYENGVLLGTTTSSGSGAWTLKIAKLSDAVHSLDIEGTDRAGNRGWTWATNLVGSSGDDVLTGGADGDGLVGGAGADRLNGGRWTDILTGGTGGDTFVFAAGQAQGDLVTDFASGTDHLEFSGYNTATAALTHLGAGLWQVSDGVTTETLTLTGVTTLTGSDYLFV